MANNGSIEIESRLETELRGMNKRTGGIAKSSEEYVKALGEQYVALGNIGVEAWEVLTQFSNDNMKDLGLAFTGFIKSNINSIDKFSTMLMDAESLLGLKVPLGKGKTKGLNLELINLASKAAYDVVDFGEDIVFGESAKAYGQTQTRLLDYGFSPQEHFTNDFSNELFLSLTGTTKEFRDAELKIMSEKWDQLYSKIASGKLGGNELTVAQSQLHFVEEYANSMVAYNNYKPKPQPIYSAQLSEVEVTGDASPYQSEALGPEFIQSESRIPEKLTGIDSTEFDENFDKQKKAITEVSALEMSHLILREQGTQDMFTNMAGAAETFFKLSGGKSKEAFAVYKALKISEATIATYDSAVKAYESMVGIPIVGPGLAVAAAAAATAFGLSRVSQIASMQPGSRGGSGGGAASVPSVSAGSSIPTLNSVSSPQTVGNPTTNNNNQKTINVTITGDVVSPQKYVRDVLGPELRKAVGDGAIEFNFN